MNFKDIKLSRKDELDILINTAIETLKDVKESKLGMQLVQWAEERDKILLIELINTFFQDELKYTTHTVVNGKAPKELIAYYREGEKVGYDNGIEKLKKVQNRINCINILALRLGSKNGS